MEIVSLHSAAEAPVEVITPSGGMREQEFVTTRRGS
jgi:hypothetical protein